MNEEFHIMLAQLQRKLGLERWDITVSFAPDDQMGGDWAQVGIVPHSHCAAVTVNEHLLSQPLATQRRCIIHELLHMVLQPILDIPKYGLEKTGVAPAAGEALLEAMRQQNEIVIDRTARALAPHL